MENTQLILLSDESRTWRLDADTRRIGRAGVARARAALEAHRADDADVDTLPTIEVMVPSPTRADDHELAA